MGDETENFVGGKADRHWAHHARTNGRSGVAGTGSPALGFPPEQEALPRISRSPYAAIQAQNFRTPSYSETDASGGGFALAYNARTGTDTRSDLGARLDRILAFNPRAVLTLRARLAWAHDWVSDPTLGAVFQTLPGASFIVNGATTAKNSALASAGTELRLANGVSLLGKFDGEFAGHSSTYAGTGTIRYTW